MLVCNIVGHTFTHTQSTVKTYCILPLTHAIHSFVVTSFALTQWNGRCIITQQMTGFEAMLPWLVNTFANET